MSSAADYWVGPTIGEGAFGHVVYAVHKTTKKKVAIKVMEAPTMTRAARGRNHNQQQIREQTAMILNERRILSLPALKSSKWIVNLWAAFCNGNHQSASSQYLYFVMELATGGDLQGLIQQAMSSHSARVSWWRDSIPHYASQLIRAADFLHSRGILHCDLKPENVLVDASNGDLKLADFGCALDTKQPQPSSSFPRGTARYSAPEIVRATAPSALTPAVDYWSVGCILHAMVHGTSPFDKGSEALTVRAIFDYVGCGSGWSNDVARAASTHTGPTAMTNKVCNESETNTKDEGKNQDQKNEDATLVNVVPACDGSSEECDNHNHYPLHQLSQGLLAVLPDDRTSCWMTVAIPPLNLKWQGDQNEHDDEDLQHKTDEKALPVSATIDATATATTANSTVLLPVPEWKDKIEATPLRDGSFGWVVFQI